MIGSKILCEKRKREQDAELDDDVSKLRRLDSQADKEEDDGRLENLNGKNELKKNVSTTLQHLPVEILEMILMKTISKNIITRNLPRSAEDENVLEIVTDMRTVWSEWNHRLTTKWFKIMFHRQLKRLGSIEYKSNPVLIGKIGPENSAIPAKGQIIAGLAMIDDELFVVKSDSTCLEVYDSNSYFLKRVLFMMELVIPYQGLPSLNINGPCDMISCNLNKCLYILVLRVVPTRLEWDVFRVDSNGKLMKRWSLGYDHVRIRLSVTSESNIVAVFADMRKLMEYSPDGCLLRQVTLNMNLGDSALAVRLSNGHFVISSESEQHSLCLVDADGFILKSFHQEKQDFPLYFTVDREGSIVIADYKRRQVILLNSDLEFKKEILSPETYGRHLARILLDERNGRLLFAIPFLKVGRYQTTAGLRIR